MLHFGRAVRAAKVLDGVHALGTLAVVLGHGRDDFGLALNGLADLADPGEQGVRVFTGHAQLFGFINQHAVIHAVQLADLVLHFGRAVRTAEVLHRVDALDAVRARRVVVLVAVVVVTAGAFAVVVMVLMAVVVVAAGAFAVVVMVLVVVVVVAAGAFAVVVMVLVAVVVVAAAAFTVVVMMIVIFSDFIMIMVNMLFYIRVFCIIVVMMP